jgi:thiol:disulfide interchange protein DsbD
VWSRLAVPALAIVFGLAGRAAIGEEATSLVLVTQDEKPAPKRRDSRIKPPEVSYEAAIEPANAKPGDAVTYKVTVKVDEPWHIYAWAAEQPKEGPRSTQFDLFGVADLVPGKEWKPDELPIRKKEPAFPDLDAVDFHENQVVWSMPLTVPKDAAAGKRTIRSQIYFQICNQVACKPPTYATLPPAELTVSDGGEPCAAIVPTREELLTALIPLTTVMYQAAPAPAETAALELPAGETGDAIREGLPAFILLALTHGLFAVLMPCVWPMVPITVNFFVKQSQAKGGRPVGLALVYCLAIIGIFTAIGLLVSIFFGAAATTKLGNNPWVNLVFAIAFFAFGLSLLGLFEIRLPSALLNASSTAESRGGVLGVMFMAATLTITSFTCTAPLVGSLLFMASKGSYFYPVVGLLAFSTVLSLPFLAVALVPSLLTKVPRGGDWMNAVKVVGGLLEIGAAFKFLNTAEVSFHGGLAAEAFFDTQVVLSLWVILALVCGIYLLGIFRTSHDLDEVKIGPGRLLTGVLFLAFALFLSPALFGNPPKSRIYDSIVGIFPPDAGELDASTRISREVVASLESSAGSGRAPSTIDVTVAAPDTKAPLTVQDNSLDRPVKATSKDPKVAIREEREVNGVSWGLSYEAALEQAKAEKKPVLIDFTGVNCANCRTMEQAVIPRPEVVGELRRFVPVRLYTDFVPIESIEKQDAEFLGEDNLDLEQGLVGQTTSPFYVIVDSDGKVLTQKAFDTSVPAFVDFLKNGLAKFETAAKVASK